MIRQIYKATDPEVRVKSKPINKIDKKLLLLIKDLKDTLEIQDDPEGVGLAAPQIGKNIRVFIFKDDEKIRTVINPEILEIKKELQDKPAKKTKSRKKTKIMEGCLSLPHYYGPLKRAQAVTIKYLNENGKEIVETFKGFSAQIIQHEIDHLNGILFIDRIIEQKAPLYEYVDGEWEKIDILP